MLEEVEAGGTGAVLPPRLQPVHLVGAVLQGSDLRL